MPICLKFERESSGIFPGLSLCKNKGLRSFSADFSIIENNPEDPERDANEKTGNCMEKGDDKRCQIYKKTKPICVSDLDN